MSADILKDWLRGARSTARWIEYDEYAARVFAGAPADWWAEPVRYADALGQARKIVRTEVLTIDLTAPCLAHAPPTGSPLDRIRAGLADPQARAFGLCALDALVHKFSGDSDLALKVAAPRDLLKRCGADDEPSFDDLDDVSSALADLVRALADRPVAALFVARAGGEPWTADETDAYGPLFGTAHHYGWLAALGVDAAILDGGGFEEVDLVLCAAAPGARLAASVAPRVGGGLTEAYWRSDTDPMLPAGALAYGVIPADAEPERIVARCAALG